MTTPIRTDPGVTTPVPVFNAQNTKIEAAIVRDSTAYDPTVRNPWPLHYGTDAVSGADALEY